MTLQGQPSSCRSKPRQYVVLHGCVSSSPASIATICLRFNTTKNQLTIQSTWLQSESTVVSLNRHMLCHPRWCCVHRNCMHWQYITSEWHLALCINCALGPPWTNANNIAEPYLIKFVIERPSAKAHTAMTYSLEPIRNLPSFIIITRGSSLQSRIMRAILMCQAAIPGMQLNVYNVIAGWRSKLG